MPKWEQFVLGLLALAAAGCSRAKVVLGSSTPVANDAGTKLPGFTGESVPPAVEALITNHQLMEAGYKFDSREPESFESMDQGDSDFRRLALSHGLYSGGTGVNCTNVAKPLALVFERLLHARRAKTWFTSLTVKSSAAGRVYGLCGLSLLDRKAFRNRLPAFANDKEMVTISSGDLIYDSEIAKLVNSNPLGSPKEFDELCRRLRP